MKGGSTMAKVMELIDPESGLMNCQICGARHYAQVKPDSKGKFYRGSWQCQNGCKPNEKE